MNSYSIVAFRSMKMTIVVFVLIQVTKKEKECTLYNIFKEPESLVAFLCKNKESQESGKR
jgi:hypothetical protein